MPLLHVDRLMQKQNQRPYDIDKDNTCGTTVMYAQVFDVADSAAGAYFLVEKLHLSIPSKDCLTAPAGDTHCRFPLFCICCTSASLKFFTLPSLCCTSMVSLSTHCLVTHAANLQIVHTVAPDEFCNNALLWRCTKRVKQTEPTILPPSCKTCAEADRLSECPSLLTWRTLHLLLNGISHCVTGQQYLQMALKSSARSIHVERVFMVCKARRRRFEYLESSRTT